MKSWGKKLGWRPEDIANAVQSPRKVANVEDMLTRMEQGDLKLRVRVLESERSFRRMELVQNNMGLAIASSGFLNIGLVLSILANTASSTTPMGSLVTLSKVFLAIGSICGIQIPIGLIKLKSLDKKFSQF